MIRRLKKDVMQELPDKVYNHVHFEITSKWRRKYAASRKVFLAELEANNGALRGPALKKHQETMSISFDAKLNSTLEWIDSFLETGKKLIIFAHHIYVIDILMERYKKIAVKVDGSVNARLRPGICKDFNTSSTLKLFIGNMKAAGTGLNITGASDVAFVELPWTPADLMQCEDRAHRKGQLETVMVHFLIARGTSEEDMALMLDKRRNRFRTIVDGKAEDKKYRVSKNLI